MRTIVLLLGLLAVTVPAALASNTANQTVTFEVSAINQISVSGNPAALTVSTATAGSEPDEVTDASTTYNITTNGSSKKITGVLDSAMPSEVTLKVNLTAPTGASSAGDVTLSATAQNLVTGITKKAEGTKGITYKLSATVAAGVVSSDTRTVTLTVTDG